MMKSKELIAIEDYLLVGPERPWQLSRYSRGVGRDSWAILDKHGELVGEFESSVTAQFVISVVNAYKLKKTTKKKVKKT